MDIDENVKTITSRINKAASSAGRNPRDIILVAATKTNDANRVREAIAAGIAVCGENRVQELVDKNAQGAYAGASLHFIGHLQRNKVRQLVGICQLIESVDSQELLTTINDQAHKLNIIQEVLLEINIGNEATKSGFAPESIAQILEAASRLTSIKVRGLMSIPPPSAETGGNKPFFAAMYKLFVDNSVKKYDNVSMDFLSMGMSGDFEDAIAEGSNMVRVGSAIFGVRDYSNKS